jgi:septum formation protein
MSIVLASVSPRRRELLEKSGLEFEIIASPAEEIHDAALDPAHLCETNARLKAAAVARMRPDATVIGADTLVFLDGEPLGKPTDLAAARAMLLRLAGRAHTVCTGVCIIRPGGAVETFHELTRVVFRDFDGAVVDRYFSLVDPLDKAGGYGIQEHGAMLVDHLEGGFDNVMGLPVDMVAAALR